MAYVDEDLSPQEIADAGIADLELARRVARLVDRAEYKRRQAPPGIKLHAEGVRPRPADADHEPLLVAGGQVSEIPVVLPKWGQSMEEATIVEWLKKAGDRVARDEPICVVETDKVDAEVLAPAAGTLTATKADPRDTVAVGTTIATIEAE